MTDTLTGSAALAWIRRFEDDFAAAEHQLTEMDRRAGDGDFGTNVASALRRVDKALPTEGDATVANVFQAVAKGFLATGGTSGPFFGMWFRNIAKSTPDDASVGQLAEGVNGGLAAIQKLGGAQVGDNTMIDALSPAAHALTDAGSSGLPLPAALAAAATAARTGAQSTGELIAARGRASYVGELARGVLDPGAVVIALFFEAGAAVVSEPVH